MHTYLEEQIYLQLIELAEQSWTKASVNFDFAPFISPGYSGTQKFVDVDGNEVDTVLFGNRQFQLYIYRLICDENQSGNVNRIAISAIKAPDLKVDVNLQYVDEIVRNFENNLPKSMRGKTLPWWKNPEEVTRLFS